MEPAYGALQSVTVEAVAVFVLLPYSPNGVEDELCSVYSGQFPGGAQRHSVAWPALFPVTVARVAVRVRGVGKRAVGRDAVHGVLLHQAL